MKIYIENVVIEITRRCNMKCRHCMRGNAQAIDADYNYIREFFRKLSGGRIGTITFTGGEPSLKPEIIEYVRMQLYHNKVELENFYIATNGKKVSKDFVDACYMLYGQCTSNEISQVAVSNDMRHAEQSDFKQGEKLFCFSFAGKKFSKDGERYELIKQGRAINDGSREMREDTIYADKNDDERFIREAQIYLNCFGEIINGCDRSYTEQKKHKICNVSENFVEKILSISKEMD